MDRIPRIDIPSPIIRDVPTPVIRSIPAPVIRQLPPPVIQRIERPSVDVPAPVIEYPVIDIQTEEEFRQQTSPTTTESDGETDPNRELPTTPPVPVQPTINIGGIEAPLPDPAPLITAGATAVVTTTVTLGATILIAKLKDSLLEPLLKRLSSKKKKIKIKQMKPILHYVMADNNNVNIFEYSQTGTRIIDTIPDVERYIRDQVEIDSLYEYDNKIMIDEAIKEKFTKEGAKRFKALFTPAKSIVKKLGSKFSI